MFSLLCYVGKIHMIRENVSATRYVLFQVSMFSTVIFDWAKSSLFGNNFGYHNMTAGERLFTEKKFGIFKFGHLYDFFLTSPTFTVKHVASPYCQ